MADASCVTSSSVMAALRRCKGEIVEESPSPTDEGEDSDDDGIAGDDDSVDGDADAVSVDADADGDADDDDDAVSVDTDGCAAMYSFITFVAFTTPHCATRDASDCNRLVSTAIIVGVVIARRAKKIVSTEQTDPRGIRSVAPELVIPPSSARVAGASSTRAMQTVSVTSQRGGRVDTPAAHIAITASHIQTTSASTGDAPCVSATIKARPTCWKSDVEDSCMRAKQRKMSVRAEASASCASVSDTAA